MSDDMPMMIVPAGTIDRFKQMWEEASVIRYPVTYVAPARPLKHPLDVYAWHSTTEFDR